MTPSELWMPSASIDNLKARAELNNQLRGFFEQRDIMEVETPNLASCGVTDPYIECVQTTLADRQYYFQSSPEYAMKRLLAAGSGDIYSLSKVYRSGENGRRHNVEFTLLEWYRLGLDDRELMAEVARLVGSLIPKLEVHSFSYQQLFERYLDVNPHQAELSILQALVSEHLDMGDYICEDISIALDLLISQVIEPLLPTGLVFVYDYPAVQAALARLTYDDEGQMIARRFEAFLNGMELANGYWELSDASEQDLRFAADLAQRRDAGLPQLEADHKLLAALKHGLPDCAGVALGVDRLLMQMLGAGSISEVISFDFSRV